VLAKKIIALLLLICILSTLTIIYWAKQPITNSDEVPINFTVTSGSGIRSATRQIAESGVPVSPLLLELVARVLGSSAKTKAGSYTFKPGTTPIRLIEQLVHGEFAQESLIIIEGWTFKQMRKAVSTHPGLKHESNHWSDRELMSKIASDVKMPEGLFFPDTYRFAKNTSDLQIYRQAFALMQKKLNEEWRRRDGEVPYMTPYQALIMASIIEKETGKQSERNLIASVFVNRLKRGMLLQTDPTVIYGMGEQYQGQIRKRDLKTDTPFNTYTRIGLPPTPICLPSGAALNAALHPAKTEALYFVSRGDGSSHFSDNLNDHNRAVNQYQR
jgi:UPF0755 protein